MNTLHVSVYEKRIDTTTHAGFYNAVFTVEYHEDNRTSETPPAIIIDGITLTTVDYLDDKANGWKLYSSRNIPSALREYIIADIDYELLKEKAIDKAGTLTGNAFKQLV